MTTIFDEAQFHWFRKKIGFVLPPVYLKLIGSQWFNSSNTITAFCVSSSSNFTASLKGCLANHRVINKLARSTVCISGRRLGQRICNFTKIFTCCVLLPQYLTRASRSVRVQKLRTKIQKISNLQSQGTLYTNLASRGYFQLKMVGRISPVVCWVSCYWRFLFLSEPVCYVRTERDANLKV